MSTRPSTFAATDGESTADARRARQVLHIGFGSLAGETKRKLARPCLAVALRLRERVRGRPGDGEGFDETVVENVGRPFARTQARDGGGEVGLRYRLRAQQGRLGRRHALTERPERCEHLRDLTLGKR